MWGCGTERDTSARHRRTGIRLVREGSGALLEEIKTVCAQRQQGRDNAKNTLLNAFRSEPRLPRASNRLLPQQSEEEDGKHPAGESQCGAHRLPSPSGLSYEKVDSFVKLIPQLIFLQNIYLVHVLPSVDAHATKGAESNMLRALKLIAMAMPLPLSLRG